MTRDFRARSCWHIDLEGGDFGVDRDAIASSSQQLLQTEEDFSLFLLINDGVFAFPLGKVVTGGVNECLYRHSFRQNLANAYTRCTGCERRIKAAALEKLETMVFLQ